MTYSGIIAKLKALADPKNVEGMARFGINPDKTLGVSMPVLRALGKETGKNHGLALKLWDSGIHEARILATIIDEPGKVTESQMEQWVKQFNSWDVCDQCCMNLFSRTEFAYRKTVQWSKRKEEFVKRAGYALMAVLAVHDKKADDGKLIKFFPIIIAGAADERNFVRKAVNWALRQIGKRNKNLNKLAIDCCNKINKLDSKAAKWIAADALRELRIKATKLKF